MSECETHRRGVQITAATFPESWEINRALDYRTVRGSDRQQETAKLGQPNLCRADIGRKTRRVFAATLSCGNDTAIGV